MFDDLSFTVAPRRAFAFFGSSGAGETARIVLHESRVVFRRADVVRCLSPQPRCIGAPMNIPTPERQQMRAVPCEATSTTMTSTAGELVLPVAVASAAGLIGSIAVMRRMRLASDAATHVALPGHRLTIALHVSPLLGAVKARVVGSRPVWGVEHRTRLPTDAIIGVTFSAALAIGSLLTTRMGSPIIISEATARHLARSLSATRAMAVSRAVLSTLSGSVRAARLSLVSGPASVVVATHALRSVGSPDATMPRDTSCSCAVAWCELPTDSTHRNADHGIRAFDHRAPEDLTS